ncbi:RsmB/NOP family class I SAM-dependent RNA methyltransferase [Oleiharenicola lentus]|uniref:RsmB/NOP family class I SAM-dependent RNA methyltransferase n=1 Tax=Oleiharenicola lentus TaxID=2508720 RepID=A0A4Q1C3E7_9BACT|nr:RsmB/NOP family class I SAM-dependent RNA methyltransferase [Oleiharenicola lentus]RXK52852.1 RsmB/NOP family class I SAM-dependent RNA methyltransferase [Oleiharenicola lentus]
MSSPVLNQAARILKLVQAGTPADQALRESLTQDRHFTDPAGRRAVSRAVFVYFRWWHWLNPKDSLQKQTEAALTLQDRFDKNPASIKAEALAARAVPDWLKNEIVLPVETLRQFQRDPVLWIRTRSGSGESVAQRLGHCTPANLPAFRFQVSGFRYSGLKDLYRTPEFQGGEFEIQDLASQLVGHACAPQPGETWWDACAGEGGKTMHLSDLLQGKGMIWATDRSARRLAKLKERAARAKAFNYRTAEWDGGAKLPTKSKFDGILVDAPCSGVGTWQRNPHARWTTQPHDVQELAVVQANLLNHVAAALKPGGRLIYSVCTLTRAETTVIADAFTSAHPDFEPIPVLGTPPSAPSAQLCLWPHELNANGMFIAAWRCRR